MADHRARSQAEAAHFDRLAESTAEIWWGSVTIAGKQRLRRRARMLAGELAASADPLVLELGCGVGAFSAPLLDERPALRLLGVDVSTRSIEIAAERLQRFARARFEEADALSLPYPADLFDAVVGNSVLHHLPLQPALSEARRVLKPGGLLWFSEPNMLNPQIAVEKNIKPIGRWLQNTPDETAFFRWPLAAALRRAGFARVAVRPFDFLHPALPALLMRPVDRLGRLLERVPLLREITGSLLIEACK
ncbi:MAG: class I SAM-dependent methyltransferase [Deltaproteobacteria bacterium]|nr:class I SAM-dependent methyltransferase [Deltaproteobacteria bacterium]